MSQKEIGKKSGQSGATLTASAGQSIKTEAPKVNELQLISASLEEAEYLSKGRVGGGRGADIEPYIQKVLLTPQFAGREDRPKEGWYKLDHNSGAVGRRIKELGLSDKLRVKGSVKEGKAKAKPCFVRHEKREV